MSRLTHFLPKIHAVDADGIHQSMMMQMVGRGITEDVVACERVEFLDVRFELVRRERVGKQFLSVVIPLQPALVWFHYGADLRCAQLRRHEQENHGGQQWRCGKSPPNHGFHNRNLRGVETL